MLTMFNKCRFNENLHSKQFVYLTQLLCINVQNDQYYQTTPDVSERILVLKFCL